MNNAAQQRFDRSVRDAVKDIEQARQRRPRVPVVRRDDKAAEKAGRRAGWTLYLGKETGATVYGPRR